MLAGWRYRVVSLVGVGVITAIALQVANHPLVQWGFTTFVPVFWRLEPTILEGSHLIAMTGLSTIVIVCCLIPLYKPRPRRVLDTIAIAQKRVIVGGLALATLGFFKWSHRLPRATLVVFVGLLLVIIPLWFVQIRRRPTADPERALIVGDDPEQINRIASETSLPVIGYLCPPSDWEPASANGPARVPARTDGSGITSATASAEVERLGGLSRIEDILVERDIDTVILAFRNADRGEFFGVLAACHDMGVGAKIHRDYADTVLTNGDSVGTLVDVKIEPWDPQDYFLKRIFDVSFAAVGLIVLLPVVVGIALAIKLEDGGSILYEQERTAGFGDSFRVFKFRTMIPSGESAEPIDDDENDRITRVGRPLRRTHLDEIPQLWAVLIGQMSVVGPRAVWIDEEAFLEREATDWRKRWFVKPGLTGLAQINDVKSTDPDAKLRYDLQYIRRQSFWFDVKIVIRQLCLVANDIVKTFRN